VLLSIVLLYLTVRDVFAFNVVAFQKKLFIKFLSSSSMLLIVSWAAGSAFCVS